MSDTTPRARGKGAVRVRGTCTAGHVTETTATPGRVTWNGQCATDGCELQILARRIPKDRRPPESPPETKTPAEPDDHAAREVSYAKPVPKREQSGKPDGPVPPAVDTAPVVAPVVVPEQQPERTGDELPHDGPADRRLVGRVRRQRAERPRPRREFQSPLDW